MLRVKTMEPLRVLKKMIIVLVLVQLDSLVKIVKQFNRIDIYPKLRLLPVNPKVGQLLLLQVTAYQLLKHCFQMVM